jgi:hypothetical protein
MRSPHADDSADELRADVAASNLPRNLAAQREGDADGRIEMSTPTGSECQYQDREDRAGRQRIVQLFLRSTGKRVPSRAKWGAGGSLPAGRRNPVDADYLMIIDSLAVAVD